MKARHYVPLVGFVVPTVLIGYGFVIPRSCIAGVNELTIGFATTILGACLTYVAGIRAVLKDQQRWMRRPEFIARQSRRPSGMLGWLIGTIMSFGAFPRTCTVSTARATWKECFGMRASEMWPADNRLERSRSDAPTYPEP